MMVAAAVAVGVVAGYLIGGIPFGLLVGRLAGVGDVREYGSGKIGFTNSLRTVGLKWALLVVAGDIAKGAAAVLVGRLLFDEPWSAALAGVAAVLGHIYPVFAGFRGGRGVSTAFGAFLAVSPPAALAVVAFSLVVLYLFRYASLMSVVGVFVGFVVVILLVATHRLAGPYAVFAVFTMLAVEVSHRGNIRRLLAGTEPKLGQGGARRASGAS
ncbi:MAG: glycerol-3-phosphate 1-O-acyltransferase [Dehalococcoidia bacterium]|nr:MAG: glycerol-3-phosphate 1-O-acyltransferase [Dehalococcoidia bacterium]